MQQLKNYSLEQLVRYCVANGKENEFWDFKQEWHEEMSDLIKDIVCFSNTVHDKDCYIIFGISDELKIVGMKKPRTKQSDILDAIANLHFAGDIYPKITVDTITINQCEIDVLTVYNEHQVPLYLKKSYGKMKSGCIYSRLGDKNTPDNGNAEFRLIENLWKKRFGLTKPPLLYIYDRLANLSEWEEYENSYYNIYHPEYVLEILDEERDLDKEFYVYVMSNSHTSYEILNIKYQSTILDTFQLVVLDGGRLTVPIPTWGCFKVDYNHRFFYKYYIQNSKEYKVLKFFYNEENLDKRWAMERLMEVVLLFASEEERRAFEKHVMENFTLLQEQLHNSKSFSHVDMGNQEITKTYQERLRLGEILKIWLNDWQKYRKSEELIEI
jgi:hypothetical protein